MGISPVFKAETASDLRQDVFKISLSLCIYPALCSFIASIFLGIYSNQSSLNGDELAAAFLKSGYYPVYMLTIALVPLLVCILVLCLLLRRKTTVLVLKPSCKKSDFFSLLVSGLIVLPAGAVASVISQKVLEFFEVNLSQIEVPSGSLATVIFILSHAVLAPVLEELLFRCVILERLRRYGDLFAVLASSLLFSLLHASFESYLPAFVSGVVLGLLAVYTGSMLCPLILHILNNALSVTMILTGDKISSTDLIYIGIIGFAFIISFSVIFYLRKEKPELFRFKFKEKIISSGRKAQLLLLSFATIVFMVFSISMALSGAAN